MDKRITKVVFFDDDQINIYYVDEKFKEGLFTVGVSTRWIKAVFRRAASLLRLLDG